MDVDIDTVPSFRPSAIFPNWVRASIARDGLLVPHPCGVYPQTMPEDKITHLAAIPYDAASDFGYLKVDFLHVSAYAPFKSRDEIEELCAQEPNWTLLQLDSTYKSLFQLSKHAEMVKAIKPKSVVEVADCMALIRPGKRPLLGLYHKSREQARRALYAKDDSGYSFKKSHAMAYAYIVVLQLHLIDQGKV